MYVVPYDVIVDAALLWYDVVVYSTAFNVCRYVYDDILMQCHFRTSNWCFFVSWLFVTTTVTQIWLSIRRVCYEWHLQWSNQTTFRCLIIVRYVQVSKINWVLKHLFMAMLGFVFSSSGGLYPCPADVCFMVWIDVFLLEDRWSFSDSQPKTRWEH